MEHLLQPLDLKVHDPPQVLGRKGMEDQDFVDAVEELGQEPRVQGFPDRLADCSSPPPSCVISWMSWLPMFEVITTMAF